MHVGRATTGFFILKKIAYSITQIILPFVPLCNTGHNSAELLLIKEDLIQLITPSFYNSLKLFSNFFSNYIYFYLIMTIII